MPSKLLHQKFEDSAFALIGEGTTRNGINRHGCMSLVTVAESMEEGCLGKSLTIQRRWLKIRTPCGNCHSSNARSSESRPMSRCRPCRRFLAGRWWSSKAERRSGGTAWRFTNCMARQPEPSPFTTRALAEWSWPRIARNSMRDRLLKSPPIATTGYGASGESGEPS